MIWGIVVAEGGRAGAGGAGALSAWGETTVIEHILDTLGRTKVEGALIVAGRDAWSIGRRVEGRGALVVGNPRRRSGRLSHVKCGLRGLPDDVSVVALMTLDQAAVPAVVIDRLVDTCVEQGGGIVVPSFRGARGRPVVFGVERFGRELLEAPEDETVERVMEQSGIEVVEVPVETRAVVLSLDEAL